MGVMMQKEIGNSALRNKSKTIPKKTEIVATKNKYKNITFLPRIFFTTAIEDAFVAGPAIRKTNTAPAETPFVIRATAIGTEAVAQTYIGNEIKSIKMKTRYLLSENRLR